MLSAFFKPIVSAVTARQYSSPSNVPSREQQLERMKASGENKDEEFDVLIIGGGSTGAGAALDAAARGLKVAMVERHDFSSGTSSRSTKLIHGGVRYLEKAFWNLDYEQFRMVKEALRERGNFFKVAPHISSWLPIMLPLYEWHKVPYMMAGIFAYDMVAGFPEKRGYFLTKRKALEQFPMLNAEGLKGACVYYDGQQNDSRMNVTLAMTAAAQGAAVANHATVESLLKNDNKRCVGAMVKDNLTGNTFPVRAKTVVSAVGPFTDAVRKMDKTENKEIVAPSSGIHIILPDYYSPPKMGLIDPATSDGRVLFFLPWLNHTIVGTTDTPCAVTDRPKPQEEEVQWLLKEVKKYFNKDLQVRRSDVLSVWSGIRPLVKDPSKSSTEALARNHIVNTDPETGLITVAGGKWTTYREMAEDTINAAVKLGNLKAKPCNTLDLKLVGADNWSPNYFISLIQKYGVSHTVARHLSQAYGDQAEQVLELEAATGKRWPKLGKQLCEGYPYIEAEVKYAVREYARTAVDVLAHRTRLAFLNKQAARDAVPTVVSLMQKELGWSQERAVEETKNAYEFLNTFGGPTPIGPITEHVQHTGEAANEAYP